MFAFNGNGSPQRCRYSLLLQVNGGRYDTLETVCDVQTDKPLRFSMEAHFAIAQLSANRSPGAQA